MLIYDCLNFSSLSNKLLSKGCFNECYFQVFCLHTSINLFDVPFLIKTFVMPFFIRIFMLKNRYFLKIFN